MKVSIGQQIEEVEYELRQRDQVFGRIAINHPGRANELQFRKQRMEAVKRTLEWLRDNEASIKAAIGEKP